MNIFLVPARIGQKIAMQIIWLAAEALPACQDLWDIGDEFRVH